MCLVKRYSESGVGENLATLMLGLKLENHMLKTIFISFLNHWYLNKQAKMKIERQNKNEKQKKQERERK